MSDKQPARDEPAHPDSHQTFFDFGKEFDVDMYCSMYDHGDSDKPLKLDMGEPYGPRSSITTQDCPTLDLRGGRGKLERWLDKHNHKMEFFRTLFALLTLGLQAIILSKLFGLI